jgi:hypothetical protein
MLRYSSPKGINISIRPLRFTMCACTCRRNGGIGAGNRAPFPPPFLAPRRAGASGSEEDLNRAAGAEASPIILRRLSNGCLSLGGRWQHEACQLVGALREGKEQARSLVSDSSAPPLSGAGGRGRSWRPVAERGVAQMDRLRGNTIANLMLERRRRHQFRSAKPRAEGVAETRRVAAGMGS